MEYSGSCICSTHPCLFNRLGISELLPEHSIKFLAIFNQPLVVVVPPLTVGFDIFAALEDHLIPGVASRPFQCGTNFSFNLTLSLFQTSEYPVALVLNLEFDPNVLLQSIDGVITVLPRFNGTGRDHRPDSR